MKNNIIAIVVITVLLAGGGFFAGMRYQQSKSPRFGNFQNMRGGQFQQRAGSGFRPVNGEIIILDEKSITVKLQDGSSKIVLVSDTTAIGKSSAGSKSDLAIGEPVAAFGTENSDGSVTAQNIQLNPQLRRGGGATPTQGQQ